jgi:hypothetical protein
MHCFSYVRRALVAGLMLVGTASAALRDHGPVDLTPNLPLEFPGGHGYPKWYRDTTGLPLQPCLNDPLSPTAGMCLPWVNNPDGYPGNHGDELFFFAADVAKFGGAGVDAGLTMALEGAYANGPPVRGDEMAFARIRIRVSLDRAINPWIPAVGTYKVTHPYGVEIFEKVAPGKRAINFTADIGVAPLAFDDVLAGRVGPFLTWDTYPDDEALKVRDGTGQIVEEYIGDPAVSHAVKGSPFGTNYFRIEGPSGCAIGGFDGSGRSIDFIETWDFAISGKKWLKPIPVKTTVNRAIYARDASSSRLMVWAIADVTVPGRPIPQLLIDGAGLPAPFSMSHDGQGRFFGTVVLGPAAPLPASITVTNTTDVPAPTAVEAGVTDLVTATASYDAAAGVLRVRAQTTDRSPGPPLLRVLGFTPGDMTPDPIDPTTMTFTASIGTGDGAVPPLNVAVVSSAGGTGIAAVSTVRDPPLAGADSFTAYQNGPAQLFDVLQNDAVVPPAVFGSLRVVQAPASGSAATPMGQQIEYRPRSGFTGVDTFAYVLEDSTGLVSNVAVVTVNVIQPKPATGVVLSASLPSPQLAGMAVVFTAVGSGSGGYDYRFWLDEGSGPRIVQDYGAGATYTLPATLPVGTYRVIAHVRTSPAVGFDARAELSYILRSSAATGVTLAADRSSPQFVGTPVVFTAAGQGASGYQYRFWLDSGAGPTIVQDYGPSSQWTMSSPAAGQYRVIVHVRTSPSVSFDARAELAYSIRLPPATSVKLSADRPSPQLAGAPVVFTAAGSGSSGYDYRFWLDGGSGPAIAQDYGNGATFTMPASAAAGTYRVIVHVRTNTAVTFDARAEIPYVLTAVP